MCECPARELDRPFCMAKHERGPHQLSATFLVALSLGFHDDVLNSVRSWEPKSSLIFPSCGLLLGQAHLDTPPSDRHLRGRLQPHNPI